LDLYGNARPCGYLLEGIPLNIRESVSTMEEAVESLKKMQAIEDKVLTKIYKKFGFAPCLMRHEKLLQIENYLRDIKSSDIKG